MLVNTKNTTYSRWRSAVFGACVVSVFLFVYQTGFSPKSNITYAPDQHYLKELDLPPLPNKTKTYKEEQQQQQQQHGTATKITKYHEWGPEGIDVDGLVAFFQDRLFNYWGYQSEKHLKTFSKGKGRNEYNYRDSAYLGVVALRKVDNVPRVYLARNIVGSTQLRGDRLRGGGRFSSSNPNNNPNEGVLPELQHALSVDLLSREGRTKYPALIAALERGTIPVIFQTSDWNLCTHDSYEYNHTTSSDTAGGTPNNGQTRRFGSVPRLAFSYVLNCGYNFPIPDYNMVELAKQITKVKNETITYPWKSKIRKAVWRGSMSHPGRKTMLNRYQNNDIFDIANTGNSSSFIQLRDMNKYRAVIDIDGHAWTDRFQTLLCSNSVVLKVQINCTSYFAKSLLPGVHYIPASVDNLTQVVKYATSDEHEEQVQSIISNANKWCERHISEESLRSDLLSILNGYAEELDRANPEWSNVWNQHAEFFFGNSTFKETGPWIDELPHRNFFRNFYSNIPTNQTKFGGVNFSFSGFPYHLSGRS